MLKKSFVAGIAILAVSAGAAFAQQGGGNGGGGNGGRGNGMPGIGRGNRELGRGALDIVGAITDATGLTMQEIRTNLASGMTLAEIITANGATVEDVTATITTTATDAINAAVADGSITQERADTLLEKLPTSITDALASTQPVRAALGDFGPGGAPGLRGEIAAALVEATDLTAEEIRTQIADGATVADLLSTANVELDTFIDGLLAETETRLAEQVTAGKINQAIANARLSLARTELEFRLSNAPVANN